MIAELSLFRLRSLVYRLLGFFPAYSDLGLTYDLEPQLGELSKTISLHHYTRCEPWYRLKSRFGC